MVSLSDNSGNPLRGNFSVSVTDSLFVKEDLARENIVSYMELCSEVRGKIENPGYYFINPSPKKRDTSTYYYLLRDGDIII